MRRIKVNDSEMKPLKRFERKRGSAKAIITNLSNENEIDGLARREKKNTNTHVEKKIRRKKQ